MQANAYIREKSDEQVENLNSVSQLAEEEGRKISEQPLGLKSHLKALK